MKRRVLRWRIRHAHWPLLLVSLLLLSGCGFFQRWTSRPEPVGSAEPVPPLQPVSFAEFDHRIYVPDRMEIPAIKLDTPVVELGWNAATDPGGRVFSRWDVAEYAAGWHKNSAMMGGGSNLVLSGHNNILGAVFRELDQLKAGDLAVISSGNVRHTYRIERIMIVPDKYATPAQRKANARWIEPFDDDRLTLVSCWPRDDNSHRIIVIASRQDGQGELSGAAQPSSTRP